MRKAALIVGTFTGAYLLSATCLCSSTASSLPTCGSFYNGTPIASEPDSAARPCPPHQPRSYKAKYTGLGYEVLDAESEACFVPDEQYMLLDDIIDEVKRSSSGVVANDRMAKLQQARDISRKIGETIRKRGFALFIDTVTFSDALHPRNKAGESERHIFDCDTGSLIYLTVAENLGLSVNLIDTTVSQGEFSHTYIRWQIDGSTAMNWDTNGEAECTTPANLPPQQGKPLGRNQALGYYRALRADLWERQAKYVKALEDYREAIKLYPESASARNNYAWLIATVDFEGRRNLIRDALEEARRAVNLVGNANHLDTLACVYALDRRFSEAIATERRAILLDEGSPSLRKHLNRFLAKQDCTGL